MYSPAALPSSTRAAPAKKRIWSTIGGSSSDSVSASGFPVFRDSAATISSARASMASAMRSSARCLTDGVASRQISKPRSAARIARSTSAASDTGAVANTSPVLGSTMPLVTPASVSTYAPSTKLRSTWGLSLIPISLRRGCRQRSWARALAGVENISDIEDRPLIPWVHGPPTTESLAPRQGRGHDGQMTPRERPVPAAGVLDEVSEAIIEQLPQDGRRSYATIAQAVGLSEAAVRQRVQRLLKSGVIQIVAVTDPLQLWFPRQAMIGIRVEGDIEAVADELEKFPEDDDHLLELLNGRIRAIPAVRSTETFVYLKLRKQTYTWGTR